MRCASSIHREIEPLLTILGHDGSTSTLTVPPRTQATRSGTGLRWGELGVPSRIPSHRQWALVLHAPTEANTILHKLHDWPLLLDFLWQWNKMRSRVPPPRALCWPPRASSRICCEYRAAKTRRRGSHKQSKDGCKWSRRSTNRWRPAVYRWQRLHASRQNSGRTRRPRWCHTRPATPAAPHFELASSPMWAKARFHEFASGRSFAPAYPMDTEQAEAAGAGATYSITSTALRSQKELVTMSSHVPGPTVNRRVSVNSGAEGWEPQNVSWRACLDRKPKKRCVLRTATHLVLVSGPRATWAQAPPSHRVRSNMSTKAGSKRYCLHRAANRFDDTTPMSPGRQTAWRPSATNVPAKQLDWTPVFMASSIPPRPWRCRATRHRLMPPSSLMTQWKQGTQPLNQQLNFFRQAAWR